jgi:threonine dehydrogenase-like Zn-dependent dehydrogenase
MRQLTCTAPGTVEWTDVPEPVLLEPTDVLVRPVAVARCEIDPFLVLAGPTRAPSFALGHEAVAEVVEVGDDVALTPGDLVLPSFQISCGTCDPCRRGVSAVCASYPLLSDYGMEPLSGTEYGGMLSDLVRVPHAATMTVRLPEGVDPLAAASVPDNALDGYRAVAPHLAARPGSDVVIAGHGVPSLGLYAAQAALALGAPSVTVAAADPAVLEVAERIGAAAIDVDFAERPSIRAPLVVDCGTEPTGLRWAIRATEPEGVLQSISSYVAGEVSLPLQRMYTLGIAFHVGRAHCAALLPEVVALLGDGRLRPDLVTTSVVDWDDAADHFTDPTIKLVITRNGAMR